MSPTARRSLVAAFALLSIVGLFRSCGEVDELRPTTLGTTPWGYGAFFELSTRLFAETARARGPDVPAQGGSVWWLPRSLSCTPASPSAAAPWPMTAWVERGGTAVIPLPGAGAVTCAVGGDVSIPERTRTPRDGGATVDGPGILARARDLPAAPRVFRAPDEAWRVRVRANGQPFVIEQSLGAGRLVVVADGSFLTNAQLALGDAAPLAAELAATWGPPVFDDGTVGNTIGGPLSYLARSTGAMPLVALALVGLVIAWHGALVPPRAPSPDDRPAPQLDDFVRSLGRLHRRSRDWSGLLARHRAWAVATIAPGLGLPGHASQAVVLDRLRAVHGAASVAPFEDATLVANEHELERRFAAVSAVVEEVAT